MKKVHFIGISGTGLSAIAKVLLERGYKVSGSDRSLTENAQRLSRLGAVVYSGHSAEQIGDVDLVIRSSAVPEENVEVRAAVKMGIPVLKRAEFLNELIGEKTCIAVSGTHGKTTTTAMIAWILVSLGIDPSYIIGSVSLNLRDNAQDGRGDVFVIEADEYDYMFLGLQPNMAIVTGIEHDHPDCYPTSEDFYLAFVQFSGQIKKPGSLLLCGNDVGAVRLLNEDKGPQHKLIFGIVDEMDSIPLYVSSKDVDFGVHNMRPNEHGCYSFKFTSSRKIDVDVDLRIPGIHNVLNAASALGAAALLDLPIEEAAEALNEFKGTERRFEIGAEHGGVVYINDYAHHPTEIRATLSAAQTRFPESRIIAVWQPHTYSRTRTFKKEFSEAFADADYVVVTDIYAAREKPPDDGFSAEDIVRSISDNPGIQNGYVRHVADIHDVASFLIQNTETGDVVVLLSAGDAELILNDVNQLRKNQPGTWELHQLKNHWVYYPFQRIKVFSP